jgi:hypothetical protein
MGEERAGMSATELGNRCSIQLSYGTEWNSNGSVLLRIFCSFFASLSGEFARAPDAC